MVVVAAVLAMLAVLGFAVTLTLVVSLAVSSFRERRLWRPSAEPFVPSRPYIDERYGATDADATRQTGWLGPTGLAGYNDVRCRWPRPLPGRRR